MLSWNMLWGSILFRKFTNPNFFLKVTNWILRSFQNIKESISLILELFLKFQIGTLVPQSPMHLLTVFQLSFLNLNYISYRQCLRACGLFTALHYKVILEEEKNQYSVLFSIILSSWVLLQFQWSLTQQNVILQ